MILRLALATIKTRFWAFVGSLVAAVFAVTLFGAAGTLMYSVITSKAPSNRFSEVPIVVSGDREVTVTTTTESDNSEKTKVKTKTESLTGAGTLPEELSTELAALSGVSQTIEDQAFALTLRADGAEMLRGAESAPVIGHGWSSAQLTPYEIVEGVPPDTAEVVLDRDLAQRGGMSVGDTVDVVSRNGAQTFRMSGVAEPPGGHSLRAQDAVFFEDTEVTEVSGLAGPTAIGVVPAQDLDSALRQQIDSAADGAQVLSGDERVHADLPGALPDYVEPISIFGFIIGLTGFAACFVLTGTITLSVRQRVAQLALLRGIGATPGQLRRMLSMESVSLATVASILSAPLAIGLAQLIGARFRDIGVVPAQFDVQVTLWVLILSGALGVLLTVISTALAARHIVRISPSEALTTSTSTPKSSVLPRLLLAAGATGGAIVLLSFVPLDGPMGLGMSFISTALLLSAAAAVGPILVRGPLALLGRLTALAGPSGWLAGLLARAEPGRVSAIAMPLMLMFGINASILMTTSVQEGLAVDQQHERTAAAETLLTPSGSLVPLGVAEQLAETTGAASMFATLPTTVIAVNGDKPQDYPAQGVFETGPEDLLDLGLVEEEERGQGSLNLADDEFASTVSLADDHGWSVGEEVTLRLPDGESAELRLVATYEHSQGFGELALPAELVASHDPAGLVSFAGLGESEQSPEQVAAQADGLWPGLLVASEAGVAATADAQTQQGAWDMMTMITFGFTAIAVVNTFAIATTDRRREYTALRLAGATVGQLRRSATREAALSILIALGLAAATAGASLGAFSYAHDGTFHLIAEPIRTGSLAILVTALGLASSWVCIRCVVRKRQALTLTDE